MENSINVKMPSSCNSSQSSLPSLVLPESKYSSTETELSDDDVNKCPFSERGAKLTVSEFSASASSSSSACKRRKRRKRRAASESKLLLTNHPSLSQRTHSCSISCSTERKISWRNTPCYYSQQICQVPCLTAPKDLRHAIGRHRGISGSSFPAIDATLFAMFYVTDAFDCVLSDASFQLLQSFRKSSALSLHNDINDDEMRKSLLNTLKKEIVYSLRISYFCPASKIVKLGQLLEENYPLDLYQDAASFLDLLFGKILDRPHSLTYSNGSVDHIYRVHLESHLKRFYHHPSPLTVQRLLQRNFSNSAGLMAFNDSGQRIALSNDSLMGSIGGGLNVNVNTITKLLTSVPYPALLIQVVRKSTENENEGDDDNDNEDTTICRRPLIPNLEIDLTNFISYNSKSIKKRGSYNYNGISSMRKESGAGADSYMTQNSNMSLSLSGEYNEGYGVGVAAESRFRKGLKSAWKVMIQYMEDLTLTSHFALLENATLPINTRDRGSEYFCNNNAHESGSPQFGGVRPTLEINNSLTTTTISSSTLSLPTRSTRARSELLNDSSTSSLTRSTSSSLQGQQQQKPPVRMELIGVICMSGNNCTSGTSSPSYSVYCKVGNGGKDATTCNDNGNSNGCKDEEGRYVPWVYYQTRPGVAPQVSLIENFEKWMESIERNLLAENFRLHQIPVEIRRVLEDSHVLIYKRKE